VCGSIKAVKYLFKYIYKGHDHVSVAMREADKEDNEEMSMRSNNTGMLDG
jgi:hypothetical protein